MNSEQLKDLVVEALEDVKAKDIVELDVRDLTTVTDYMIVASGTSTRHVQALADTVIEKATEAGCKPIGVEGENGGEWVLLDLQDTLGGAEEIHVGTRRAAGLDRVVRALAQHFGLSRRASDRPVEHG